MDTRFEKYNHNNNYLVCCISYAYVQHQIKVRQTPNKLTSNLSIQHKHIIMLGLFNILVSALWIYDTMYAMYPHTSQSFEHTPTRVNILGPTDTMHVFNCMAKMVTNLIWDNYA